MRYSAEVQNILREAREIADGAGQSFTTAHILLGMLTSTNRAAAVLEDLRIAPEQIVESLSAVKRADRHLHESEELLARVEDRMLEAARRSDALLVSSLHLLMALTREKPSIAYKLFAFMGVPPAQVRTLALGRITGPVPRSVARRAAAQWQQRERLYADEPVGAVAIAESEPQLPENRRPRGEKAREQVPSQPPERKPSVTEQSPFADDEDGESTPVPRAQPVLNRDGEAPAQPLGPYDLDPEEFPLLTALGRNLTSDASAGQLDPCIGRQAVIDTMIDVLNKRRSNNPCLVGDPGVGKTAVVEGLALAMLEQSERVAALRDRVIIEIDVGAMVAGTELRGSFSRRMARLKDEVRKADGAVIVFIDELHTLVGAGSGDGALDAANDLKAALARGNFPCIGATTRQEYHRHIERDPALERRFQPIEVDEPSEEDALEILRGIVDRYEAHHGVIYEATALEAAVRMSARYLVERRLPDKAINLIDTAAARAVRHGNETVEKRDVAEVVCELAGIPVARLMMSDAERMLAIREHLRERIIGHDEVMELIGEVIQRNSAGFSSNRPIGSFLFLGPTGVGKTETAKVLAEFLFGSKDAMTRFDMSEFMERHAVARFIGAAPGYVGHEDAGELTKALKRRPYQIVLFDEIEKAHPDVLNILLQILDEGHITDSKGHQLRFSNTVIVMTSNLGADALEQRRRIGFGDEADDAKARQKDLDRMVDKARKALPPELWGRIDEKCVFAPLGHAEVAAIARLLVEESSGRLEKERDIAYEVTSDVVEYLIEHGGWEAALGARPMRRAVQRLCETAIARAILSGEADSGDRLKLDVIDGEIVVVPA